MSAKRGEKAMKIQSPCGFPQGFRCLHVHYTLSHIENQPAAKKFMFTMFDEKTRISDIFLGLCSYIFRFSAKQRHVENSVHSHAKKLLQFVHIPGFRKRLRLHAFCGKRRSFIKRAALPLFGRPPNWVSRALTVQWTVNAPVLIFGQAKRFRALRSSTKGFTFGI